jgi:hypothetical protein
VNVFLHREQGNPLPHQAHINPTTPPTGTIRLHGRQAWQQQQQQQQQRRPQEQQHRRRAISGLCLSKRASQITPASGVHDMALSRCHSVIGCFTKHRPFEEPTRGSLAILRTTATSQLCYHNWYTLNPQDELQIVDIVD